MLENSLLVQGSGGFEGWSYYVLDLRLRYRCVVGFCGVLINLKDWMCACASLIVFEVWSYRRL